MGGSGGASAPHAPRRRSLRHPRSAPLRVVFISLVLLLLSACRMEIDVNVLVSEDGSGSVEVVVGLDEDAVERIGGDLSAVMEVDDLLASGWRLDGPDLRGAHGVGAVVRRLVAKAREPALVEHLLAALVDLDPDLVPAVTASHPGHRGILPARVSAPATGGVGPPVFSGRRARTRRPPGAHHEAGGPPREGPSAPTSAGS